ncbi:MAG: aminotransferase class III-fold pyridoxal phosphate-dependent enzyme [Hydrococcus sp. Prado102]|jgi:acyl carrier protein|nr:aminotransferase class III-fold pyridoxal phosphate-dependent enzyme [Hydrococcus sp. Prado102]
MEPIAIIGIGCRFPKAQNPESFWQLLRNGVDAITEVPSDRWYSDSNTHTRWGGFLEQVDRFDPGFFGISPREAQSIDPQQRLLLEVAWETLENAGVNPKKLSGSQTGVFVGVTNVDYNRLVCKELSNLEPYSGTGTSNSIAANRLSYFLDLRGPSVAIDTACSSSLVALHFACQSLHSGESDLCLAGGVNLILSPEPTIIFSQAGMMAADGRCKTFDASADGYVRGEGCGIVVLKRLKDAVRDGDRIQAIIKGSAVNQDGLSNGITAPNGPAQQAVIRQALLNAGVQPAEISYIEAHGTGTSLGDPIEMNSLKAVLKQERSQDNPCWIGSVKTNIGHLESAAGIAGLIKVVLSLQHQEIPPHLHLNQLNKHITLEGTPFAIATECNPWTVQADRRLAGVSAFGFGGTNCHVILEEAPFEKSKVVGVARPLDVSRKSKAKAHGVLPNSDQLSVKTHHILTLSAKSDRALQELAQRYEEFLEIHREASLADVCFTANTGRSHFDRRLCAVVESTNQLQKALAAFATGKEVDGLASTQIVSKKRPKIAFLFTGQGSQYLGMGRHLYETQPTFRAALDKCASILQPYLETPLLEILYPQSKIQNPKSKIDETAYTQPALFAVEYALFQLWKSWGIIPDAVMGHSVGEYVAACVAGVFSLEDGLRLIAQRASLMQALPQDGCMVAAFADEATVSAAIQSYRNDVSIAAINGPKNVVISGSRQVIEVVAIDLEAQGIETRPLTVSHAFHSPLMEPILNEFEDKASQIFFQTPNIPFISNLTGQIIQSGDIPDANYWRSHAREAVRFMDGLNTLFAQGYELFLEIGSKPILSSLGKRSQQSESAVWLSSLSQTKNDWQVLLESLSALYLRGVEIDWMELDRNCDRKRLSLPTYPFQRKRYWIQQENFSMNDNISDLKVSELQIKNAPQTKHQDEILTKLRSIVANLLKVAPSELDIHAPFLEMGADSIVIVDAVRVIENTYGIKIAIRQFFEELTTIDALANYIAQNTSPLPESELEVLAQQPARSTATMEEAIDHSTQNGKKRETLPHAAVEEIIRQQIQLMSEQLEVLRGNGLSAQDFLPKLKMPFQIQEIATQGEKIDESKDVVYRVSTHPSSNNGHSTKNVQQDRPAAPSNPSTVLFPWKVSEIRARGLTEQQQQYLDALVSRYTQRTQTSKQLTQNYRPVLADNRTSVGFRFSTKEMLYPIIGKRSRGSRLWDVDENEYIDISMGFGVNLFGHHPQFIVEAIEEQLKQGMQLGPQTSLAGEVAQLICELTGMERVTFCNSGTEAVMTALRLARTATGRHKIAMFAGSFHGHFDGTLANAQADKETPNSVPMAPGITPNTIADVLVLDYDDPRSLDIIQAHAGELAAVLVEPVQSRRPNLQPKAFLQQLRQLTKEAGIALIFDEMITGFRIHPGGAQAWFGIDADIATYGKIVGGGMPIGAIAGKAIYMNGMDGGMWNYGDASYPQADMTFFAGTFCKHPLTMAAARAVLTEIKSRGLALQEQLNQRTAKLAATLNDYFERENLPIEIVHFGSLFRFAFSSNMDLLFYHLLEKGIYVWEGRNCFLSTEHTDEDINRLIQALKDSIEELREGGFLPPRAIEKTDKVPLTEAQKQLWILDRMGDEGSLAYAISLSLQLQGSLNREALNRAVQQVVDRHEALRTIIDAQGDFQQILPSLTVDVPLIDLSSVGDRESNVTEWFQKESQQRFDLIEGPLFRCQILKLEEQRHLFVLTAHHIIADGWSMGTIIQEISQLYSADCQDVVCQLPSPKQFREYVNWQEEQRQTENMVAHESYWLDKFASSIPVLNLPTDRPRPQIKTYKGSRETIHLDANLYREVKRVSNEKSCTPFMTLLSVYTTLLHQLTGQDDIVVGIPTAGRSFEGSEGLVGYCSHLLPIRSYIDRDLIFSDYLKTLKSILLDAYEHQDYPFARLLDKLKLRRNASQSPLITAIFNLDRAVDVPKMSGLEVNLFPQNSSFSRFDISLHAIELDGELMLDCDYNTDLFNPATIQFILDRFQYLLDLVTKSDFKLKDLGAIFDEADRQQFLVKEQAFKQTSLQKLKNISRKAISV